MRQLGLGSGAESYPERPDETGFVGMAHDVGSIIPGTIVCSILVSRFEKEYNAYIEAAEVMLMDDVASNKAIGSYGASLIQNQLKHLNMLSILTHCNTGSLATTGYGTALRVIRALHDAGVLERAYCTETSPFNQWLHATGHRVVYREFHPAITCLRFSCRLDEHQMLKDELEFTILKGKLECGYAHCCFKANIDFGIQTDRAFELVHDNIPATLIADSAAAALMKARRVDGVIVGADRVAANGDTANSLIRLAPTALLCAHSITELLHSRGGLGEQVAASGISVWNPAFDVTPACMISGIITEKGVITKGGSDLFNIKDFVGKTTGNSQQ
ncbi:NagB/RpiA/CoA transferase-like superfamily protein [Actinidia rufa]|uniref:NagB/RpiA/CoA transferase-like superfamily protein n=1 Tax=Actinidia rufa TaxID=165716 RepID=A0A7J0EI23_9ERIC|nr:NagB/RpiA/CoA transferase-like superfamily protein [Actinidia rufa]